MNIIITGGHHTSSIPVIMDIKKNHKDINIFFVGSKSTLSKNKNTSLEFIDITNLNIPYYKITTGKFYKKFDLINFIKIIIGLFQSLFILIKVKPDIVLSFGGYIAVPVVIVAKLLKIKILTHEQTLVSGYANKLISKIADKVFISWPQSIKYFNPNKTIVTGIPIRNEIYKSTTNNYIIQNKLPTIYVTGGKSGSNVINKNVLKILPDLLDEFNVIHQCGDNSQTKDYDMLLEISSKLTSKKGMYFLKKFIDIKEIGEVFSKCDFVISRSGAHTISELIILNKPGILIPIPWSSHNEQYENAKLVNDLGLAEILQQHELTPLFLINKIKDFNHNLKSYKLNDNKIKNFLQKDSSKIIVDEIYKTYKS